MTPALQAPLPSQSSRFLLEAWKGLGWMRCVDGWSERMGGRDVLEILTTIPGGGGIWNRRNHLEEGC